MDLMLWTIEYKPGWDSHFKHFDKSVQIQIFKKLEQMKQPLSARGLHGNHYLVEEVGQYRIAFFQDYELQAKQIHFIGNHKQYDKWCREIG